MEQNQFSHATGYNRYPQIFEEIQTIIPNPTRVLSFGCSTGLECNTLRELYFPNSEIVGLDISEDVINDNIKNNVYENIKYTSTVEQIIQKFDLIFAMSVLCVWPESDGIYSFETFSKTINIIDSLLEQGGYLCIYNSKYLFTNTDIFKNYVIINMNHKETGFVKKYSRATNNIIVDYPYFLFQKKIKLQVELEYAI